MPSSHTASTSPKDKSPQPGAPSQKSIVIENPQTLPLDIGDSSASQSSVSSSFRLRGSATPPPIPTPLSPQSE